MRAQAEPITEMTGMEAAAAALVAGLPRDQALGLRLLCLARAATAVHMGQACAADGESCAAGASERRAGGDQAAQVRAMAVGGEVRG